jgi:Na+-driven multidrug efflux pump
VKLVSSIMPLLALFQVFDGTSAVTGGVLRARGKQFVGALLNLRRVLFSYFAQCALALTSSSHQCLLYLR